MPQIAEKQDWKAALNKKKELFQAVFGPANPHGQAVLKELERTFQSGTMLSDSQTQLAYNVGQHELVSYIKQLSEDSHV
jgi:hypothetical protein